MQHLTVEYVEQAVEYATQQLSQLNERSSRHLHNINHVGSPSFALIHALSNAAALACS